jgi:protein-S-isoprenylcysteine O-methyltransferase Ste14
LIASRQSTGGTSLPDWIAAIVFFLQLPIPLYWFVLHPGAHFWRQRRGVAFAIALLLSWFPVTVVLIVFRSELFQRDWPPAWQFALGIALNLFEIWIFWRVRVDLGGARLVGATELSGGGEIAERGIYGRIRHPRYVGSFIAIVGACLIGGTRTAWIVAAAWTALTRVAIAMEERELRTRFGAAYREYCRRVPGYLPRR